MAKLSKEAAKRHKQALDLVYSDKSLRLEDRYFILEHFHESATNMNGLAGAFFTPEGLANDFSIEVPECESLIDLCAGIGRLAFACRERAKRIVCVEINPEYAEVGKRVLPEAEWIVSDVFSIPDMGRFSTAISNPPFGSVKTGQAFDGRYTGASFEYKLIEAASKIADHGVFIIPQTSAPFRYSGQRSYSVEITRECEKFMSQTGIVLDHNCGLDTSAYKNEWHGVSPICEIVLCDFTQDPAEIPAAPAEAEQNSVSKAVVAPPALIPPPAPAQSEPTLATVPDRAVAPAPTAPARMKASRKPDTGSANPQSFAQLSLFDAA
ncbi:MULTISPECIES: methyltransferase [Pseudomonas]|jgi:predicted RNA methylase|uniref:Methyltransferase n=4 Tax=Pseudomonas TaxID=286 RepID=A0A223Q4F3_PSEPU|nr:MULTISPECIES: methyltransferase [Pseudomonas]AVX92441.1 methyltransferase [Pseudomonas koreensis]WQN30235.1 methyltransferase [Stutzerimonas stutzeri]AGL46232.1 hypothetical protein pOZ176_268 [Pseudomonas aeruginosa PA96]ANI18909.1 methyltransferase [Pseudomonas citronellolis]ANP63335.1 methyltransferase [Pseudomonas aeruginosa]